MKTNVLKMDGEGYAIATNIIDEGGLVAFYTETVYGLGANAFDDDAVKSIFSAKGRPQDNPLIVHADSFDAARKITKNISEKAEKLAKAFMPGSLTMVLEKTDSVSDFVSCGLSTVGIRVPKSQAARDFLKSVGVPIAAPSANTSKRPSPTKARHVLEDFDGKIPLILDGGSCDVGIESTVIDMTQEPPLLLRPGIVTRSDIEKVIGHIEVGGKETGRVASPGMKYKHYAPSCDMFMIQGDFMSKLAGVYSETCVVFAYEDTCLNLKGFNFRSLGADNLVASNRFYSLLRECEKAYETIICEYPRLDDVGASLLNRMVKSCDGKII